MTDLLIVNTNRLSVLSMSWCPLGNIPGTENHAGRQNVKPSSSWNMLMWVCLGVGMWWKINLIVRKKIRRNCRSPFLLTCNQSRFAWTCDISDTRAVRTPLKQNGQVFTPHHHHPTPPRRLDCCHGRFVLVTVGIQRHRDANRTWQLRSSARNPTTNFQQPLPAYGERREYLKPLIGAVSLLRGGPYSTWGNCWVTCGHYSTYETKRCEFQDFILGEKHLDTQRKIGLEVNLVSCLGISSSSESIYLDQKSQKRSSGSPLPRHFHQSWGAEIASVCLEASWPDASHCRGAAGLLWVVWALHSKYKFNHLVAAVPFHGHLIFPDLSLSFGQIH